MSTPKGWSSQEKDERLKQEFVTVQPIGEKKFGMDVHVSMYHHLINDGDLIDAVVTEDDGSINTLTINTHGAKKGDLLYFKTGAQTNRQIKIDSVPDANTIVLAETILSTEPLPLAGDEVDILSPIQPRTNSEGDLIVSPGPTKFILDGTTVDVIEDTVTPANNQPLPVKLAGLDGDVVINNANLNLEVQLDHNSANPDSVQIGDGTDLLAINTNGTISLGDNAVVFDAGQENSAGSFPVVLSSEQEAMIDGIEGLLTTIDADTGVIAGDTTSIDGKLPATLGQKANATSLAVALSTEQEAMIDGIEGLLTTIDTDTGNIDNKLPATLGQKANAASLAVTLSTEQEAMIDGIEGLLTTIDADTGSIDGKLPISLGEKAESASLAVTLSTENEAILSNIDTSLNNIEAATSTLTPVDFLDAGVLDTSSTNIPTTGTVDLVTLAANVSKILVIDDIGEYMSLRTSAGAVLAYLPLGGGEIDISITSGTALKLYSESGATISTGKIAINFLG